MKMGTNHTMQDVIDAASKHDIDVLGLITNDNGGSLVKFQYDMSESSTVYFSSGWLSNEQQAIDFAYGLMQETTGDIMNILQNDKLFPNIRGVMLKDKPVTLHLSGKFKITELQGGDARCELFFSDHKKTAVVNRNQILAIVEVYGKETNDWKGKPVVLYGEEGVWFGKHQWGVRIDPKATEIAWKKEQKTNGKARKAELEPLEDAIEEVEQAIATRFTEDREQDIEQLAADLFDDPNGAYAE